ncbi:MAG TPA: SDR family NAD(P)-dependent oxidoreductase, partial [Candidatus Methylomirabilis sp.]|nr:SDR family NAD(P)-dependent oxidoreductase [Candidatus Methylomirabilis sp.]
MDTFPLGLEGKIAIVTGGSQGLGRATAERLARCGVRVGMCARRKAVLEDAAEDIRRATGGDLLAMTCDVTRAAEVEA